MDYEYLHPYLAQVSKIFKHFIFGFERFSLCIYYVF